MYGDDRRGGGFQPRGGNGQGFGVAPVQVGEELDVRIEAVGEKGDGIARKRGFILFVPNTKEGDEVRIKVTKVLRKVGFADVVGQAQSTPPADDRPAPAQAAAPAPAPMPEPEPSPEDSEDFGEEEAAEEPAPEMEAPPEPEAPEEEAAPEVPEAPEAPEPEAPAEELQDAEQPEGLPPEAERPAEEEKKEE